MGIYLFIHLSNNLCIFDDEPSMVLDISFIWKGEVVCQFQILQMNKTLAVFQFLKAIPHFSAILKYLLHLLSVCSNCKLYLLFVVAKVMRF